MPYNFFIAPSAENVDWGDLTGKAGKFLRVKADETGVEFKDKIDVFSDTMMNSNVLMLFHYDFGNPACTTYTGSNISAIVDLSSRAKHVVSIEGYQKSGSLQNGKYFLDGGALNVNRNITQSFTNSISQLVLNVPTNPSITFSFLCRFTGAFSNMTGGVNWELWPINVGDGGSLSLYRITYLNSPPNFFSLPSNYGTLPSSFVLNTFYQVTYIYKASTTTHYLYVNDVLFNTVVQARPQTNYTTGMSLFNRNSQINANGTIAHSGSQNPFLGDLLDVYAILSDDVDLMKRMNARVAWNWGLNQQVLQANSPYYSVEPYLS